MKQTTPKVEVVDANIADKANTKENELQQILEMFGGVIDKEIISDYWNGLNADYEQTISILSDMVDEIERQKKVDEAKKVKIEETKKSK